MVSAHLDDAVLSCYAALGPESTVITVFAGFPPEGTLGSWDAAGGATDSRERVAERREEDRRALATSGSQLIHLDLLDEQYSAAERPSSDDLARSLRTHVAGAGQVLAPCALANPDHRLVRDAVLSLRPGATLYADLPYALHPKTIGFALPADVDGSSRVERRVQLSPDLIEEKLAAVRCYTTQVRQLADDFGDFLDAGGLGLEVYWAPAGS